MSRHKKCFYRSSRSWLKTTPVQPKQVRDDRRHRQVNNRLPHGVGKKENVMEIEKWTPEFVSNFYAEHGVYPICGGAEDDDKEKTDDDDTDDDDKDLSDDE